MFKCKPTALPNNNSGIATLRLAGRNCLIAAYNPTAVTDEPVAVKKVRGPRGGVKVERADLKWQMAQRYPLCVSYSRDDGLHWSAPKAVHADAPDAPPSVAACRKRTRDEQQREYSYPALAQTPDGLVHLTFTFNRESIVHYTFTEEWVFE